MAMAEQGVELWAPLETPHWDEAAAATVVAKRTFDVVAATVLLLVLAPLLIVWRWRWG